MYNTGMGELFDIGETRRALQARRAELLAECTANSKLQARFDQISAQLHPTSASSSGVGGVGGQGHNQAQGGPYPYQGGGTGLGMAGQANMGGSVPSSEKRDEASKQARAEPVTREQYENYSTSGSMGSDGDSVDEDEV